MTNEINETASSPESAPSGSNPFNKNAIIGGAVIIVLLVGVFFVFGGGEAEPEPILDEATTEDSLRQMVESEADLEEDTVVEEAPADVKEFTLSATNFAFAPNELRAAQGDTVRITLVNDGTMPHDFRLDEFNAATRVIQGGQQDTIEFVVDQAGEFEYYCSVGNHRQMGMVGTLMVE